MERDLEALYQIVRKLQILVEHINAGLVIYPTPTDHGMLTGLGDDDHPQYLNDARHSVADHTIGTVVPHDTLDAILNPVADAEWNMTNNHFELRFNGPVSGGGVDGAFEVEAIGAFTGDLVHIHQHTGNPSSPTDLIHMEATDVDVLGMRVQHNNASGVVALFTQNSADILKVTNQLESRTILPFATDAYDLGSSSRIWQALYVSQVDTFLLKENAISVVGGLQVIGKGQGSLPSDITNVQTSIDFGPGSVMAANDFILFKISGAFEYMQLASGGPTTWTVTRSVDAPGVASAWPAGSVWLNLGYNGTGRIELDAVQTPRISMLKQATTYNLPVEMLRIGDLNAGWGYVAETYGMAIGEYGSNKPNITIESTNGLRIRNNTTVVLQFDVSGNADILGKLRMPGASSAIAIGSTPPTSAAAGTGIWLDRTGLYGLASNVVQAKIDAATGKIVAGAGTITLDANGINITSDVPSGYGHIGMGNGDIYCNDTGLINLHTSQWRALIGAGEVSIDGQGNVRLIPANTTNGNLHANSLSMGAGVPSGTRERATLTILETTTPSTPPASNFKNHIFTGGYPVGINAAGVRIPEFVSRVSVPVLQGYFVGATVVTMATNAKAVSLRNANLDIIYYSLSVPPGWGGKTFSVNFWWSPTSTNALVARFNAELRLVTHGVTVAAAASSSLAVDSTSPGIIDRVVKVTMSPLTMGAEGQAIAFDFYRDGNHVNDTFTGNSNILAIELVLV